MRLPGKCQWPDPRQYRLTLAVLLCLGLSSCAVGPDFKQPPVKLQAQWSTGTGMQQGPGHGLTDWWQQFDDPTLNSLLQQGLAQSPTLQSAAVTIAQAQAQLGISEANTMPSLQLSASRSYNKPDMSNQLQGKSGGSSSQQISLQASWEPDFWGAVRRGVEADQASWLSTLAAYQASRVALEASIANTYFSVRTLQTRLKVAQDNLAQQQENLRISQARFTAGSVSEQDVRQAQVQYEQTQSTIPTMQATLEQNAHALSVLIGETPDYYLKHNANPAGAPRTPAGMPADIPRNLLLRRPDVLQAQYSAAAQSARIGQAKANLYPSFTLNGSFGYQSSDSGNNSLNDLFNWNNPVTTATAGFLFPIFNHGLLVNQVRVQDAIFQQAILNYQNKVLSAQQDVEDALSSIRGNTASKTSLESARTAAERSTKLAIERYKAGETDFTTVTSANQTQLQVEDGLVQANGNLLQAYVAAYRALGGGWDGKLTATLSDDVRQQMQDRTHWGDALKLPSSQRPAQ